jgi:flagellar hook-basal body complex protein FliE
MTDPLGIIGNIGATNRIGSPMPGKGEDAASGPGFKEMLQQQIDQVNRLQNDAKAAMEDLAAGRRDDVESVMTATLKADMAFRMLLQVRNKVMDAYEEVKQLRI